MALQLRPGQSLFSTVDTTSVVVIKAPSVPVTVSVSGAEVSDVKPVDTPADITNGRGVQIGKRYVDDTVGIELLASKAGTGTLEINGNEMSIKDTKPLPASD